jgi:CRP-like cAMP-binding protein
MDILSNRIGNSLFDSLPVESRERLVSIGKWEKLEADANLTLSDRLQESACFPIDSVVHFYTQFADGRGSEILMVASDGFFGSRLFPLVSESSTNALVLRPGRAFKVPQSALIEEFNREDLVRWKIVHALHQFHAQTAETAACSACLRLDQMLCRWFVMFSERAQSREIVMTQERVAQALGVRREGVSHAMKRLRESGAIDNQRSRIVIRDLDKLRVTDIDGAYSPALDQQASGQLAV